MAPVAAGWYSTCGAATGRDLQLGGVLFCVTVGKLLLKNGQLGQTDQFPSAGETAVHLATSASSGCASHPTDLPVEERGKVGQRALCQKFCLSFGILEMALPSGCGGGVGCLSDFFLPLPFCT